MPPKSVIFPDSYRTESCRAPLESALIQKALDLEINKGSVLTDTLALAVKNNLGRRRYT